MRSISVLSGQYVSYGRKAFLASIVVVASATGTRPHAQETLPANPERILDLVVETARHGDLRDVAFIERTFKVVLKQEEWRKSDGSVLGFRAGPTPLPFATGRSFLSLLIRTPPTVFPTGEYEVGDLSIMLIDTVHCVRKQEAERRLTSAFGSHTPGPLPTDGADISFFTAIKDKDKAIYVAPNYGAESCLSGVLIIHRR